MAWDRATLDLIGDAYEVRIRTTRPDGSQRQKIIWAVVDGDDVFVRSVRGDRGRWFQAAIDRPDEVELIVGKSVLPVRAVLADDDASVQRCSAVLQAKYAADPALGTMLRPHTLGTTLRLEPR